MGKDIKERMDQYQIQNGMQKLMQKVGAEHLKE